MIDVVVHRKRHFRIGAINRRGRCVEQMSASVVAASLEYRGKARQVGIDIGEGIDQRLTNAGLRSKMNDVWETVLLEQRGNSAAVRKVEPDEAQMFRLREFRQARLL